MHVFYISAYDQPKGNSTRSYDFARCLVEMGHQVTFFTNSFCHFTHKDNLSYYEIFRQEAIQGINVVWLKTPSYKGNGFSRGLNMLFNAWRIITVSKKYDFGIPDVIIGPSVPLFTGLSAYILSHRYDKPFVFEIRDVWPEALVLMGAISKISITYFMFRLIEKFLYKKAEIIISTLPYVHKHVKSSIGISKSIEYIPNGVDFSLYGSLCSPKQLNKCTEIKVTYIGGFGVDHDIDLILQVAKHYHEKANNIFRFDLFGSGIKKIKLNNLSKDIR